MTTIYRWACQFLCMSFPSTSGCRPSEVKRRVLGCSYFYLVTAVNLIMAKLKCNISLPHEWVLWAVPKTLLQLAHKLPGLRSIRRTVTSFHFWCLSFSIFKLYYNSISWQNSNPIYCCSINSTRGSQNLDSPCSTAAPVSSASLCIQCHSFWWSAYALIKKCHPTHPSLGMLAP